VCHLLSLFTVVTRTKMNLNRIYNVTCLKIMYCEKFVKCGEIFVYVD
jgi:hypothetical protein